MGKIIDGIEYEFRDNSESFAVIGLGEGNKRVKEITILADIDGIPVTEIIDSTFENTQLENFLPIVDILPIIRISNKERKDNKVWKTKSKNSSATISRHTPPMIASTACTR